MSYKNLIKQTNPQNLFMNHLGINVTSVRENHAELEMDIREYSYNPYHVVHGGVYFTIADCAAGVTARSTGERFVTLNSSFNFMKAVSSGKLRAAGETIYRGGSTCIVRSQVFDDNGALVAEGTFTMFKLKPREKAEE